MLIYYCCKNLFAVVAQSVEHYIGSVEVTGPIPVNSSKTGTIKVPVLLIKIVYPIIK